MKNALTAFLFFVFCGTLAAHPMGNFSINHYSGISMSEKGIAIHFIIDMAEIPAFQEMSAVDSNGDRQISNEEADRYSTRQVQSFQQNLHFSLNGKAMSLVPRNHGFRVVPGAGGLPTFVVSGDYLISWDGSARQNNVIVFSDSNFSERIGWKEIVLIRNQKMPVTESTASSVDRSKQLTEYPSDPTTSAPQETEAKINFTMTPEVIASLQDSERMDSVHPSGTFASFASQFSKRDDRFTRLISQKDLGSGIVLISLLIAFGLGAMHALSPGHGKTIVAGYLIGSRGTAYHALFLGAVVTLTHTIGVFALGLLTLYGSRYILPEKLYPWLSFFSGISILVIGASLFRKRMGMLKRKQVGLHHSHSHHHDHGHHHDHDSHHSHASHHHHDSHAHHHHDHDEHSNHGHSHLPIDPQTGAITLKSLLTVGISGGALPCPSALVVLLSAISLHRVGFGLLLIVGFSLGLAVVLTSIGLLLVYASSITKRFESYGGLLTRMPLASSLIIAILGLAIALKSFL